MLKQYRLKNYHFQLVVYIIALSIIGILLIGSAKHSVQSKQIIGFVMGLTIMIVLSLIDYISAQIRVDILCRNDCAAVACSICR